MAQESEVITINSEEQAFEVLKYALETDRYHKSPVLVNFVGWPQLRVRLTTKDPYTISPSMMDAYIEYQDALYRARQLIDEGSIDLRSLSDDERALYEFEIKLSGGSSVQDIDLTEIMTKLGAEVVAKMTPEHILILILGLALVFAASSCVKAYLQSKVERRKEELASEERRLLLETQQFVSAQETQRMELLFGARSKVPLIGDLEDIASDGHLALVRGVASSGGGEIGGAYLSGEVAAELTRTRRQVAREEMLDDAFTVLQVDTRSEEGFRVRFQHVGNGEEFYATLQDRIASASHYEAIQRAEWNKVPVRLRLRARRLRGRIVEALVLDASLGDQVRN